MSCDARALAVTGAHDDAKAAGRMTVGYRDVLETMFGAQWVEGGALVKHWGRLCDAAKRRR